MPPVQLKYVVSFSSQDPNFPVKNLMQTEGYKKWLSEQSRKVFTIDAVFQLEKDTAISHIDIGLIWVATIEIQVGRSEWPQDREFLTLVPTASVMSPVECRLGNNVNRTRMFCSENMAENVAKEKWDRLKIICRQPFRKDVQFGVNFLKIQTTNMKTSNTPCVYAQKTFESIARKLSTPEDSKGKSIEENLKTKLLKIAGSSENGTDHVSSLSRTAKLVMAASGGSTSKSIQVANETAKKETAKFEGEVSEFLCELNLQLSDLDTVTIADIRHSFEEQKNKKLTQNEKRILKELTYTHIDSCFEKEKISQNLSLDYDFKLREEATVSSKKQKQDKNELNDENSPINTGKIKPKTPNSLYKSLKSPRFAPLNEKKISSNDSIVKSGKRNLENIYVSKLCDKESSVTGLISDDKEGADDSFSELEYDSDSGPGDFGGYEPPKNKTTKNKTPNKQRVSLVESKSPISTNDMWLSKNSPVIVPSPSTKNKTKRRHLTAPASTTASQVKKQNPKKGRKSLGTDNLLQDASQAIDMTHSGNSTRKRKQQMRNPRVKETPPVLFERCPLCKETFPPDQVISHRQQCLEYTTIKTKLSNRSNNQFGNHKNTLMSHDDSVSNNNTQPRKRKCHSEKRDIFVISSDSDSDNSLEDPFQLSQEIPQSWGFCDGISLQPSLAEVNIEDTYRDQYVECPLCGELFRQCAVERHAASCSL